MTQQSQIHATIAGRLYTFTLTATTDTPVGEAAPAEVRTEVSAVVHYAGGLLRVGLAKHLNAEVQLVQGPVEVPERVAEETEI